MRISQLILKLCGQFCLTLFLLLLTQNFTCNHFRFTVNALISDEPRGWGWKESKITQPNIICYKRDTGKVILLTPVLIKGLKLLSAFVSLLLLNTITYFVTTTAVTIAASIPCFIPRPPLVLLSVPPPPTMTAAVPTTLSTTTSTTTPPTTTTTTTTTTTRPTTTTTTTIVFTCPPCFCGRSTKFDEEKQVEVQDISRDIQYETKLVKALENQSCFKRFLCEVKQQNVGQGQDYNNFIQENVSKILHRTFSGVEDASLKEKISHLIKFVVFPSEFETMKTKTIPNCKVIPCKKFKVIQSYFLKITE